MKILSAILWSLLAIGSGFANNDYPLTMTAVFTEGQIAPLHEPDKMYHAGEYDCTRGDENNAPECHTVAEWAELDAIGGTPNTVVFTMADGSQIGVQSITIHKIPGFIECRSTTPVIFCNLYFEFLRRQQVSLQRQTKYGQTELLSSEEYDAAAKARKKQLFGQGNTTTLVFRYKLKGNPKNGFQRIEVDKSSCVQEHGVNYCGAIPEALNARANGYVVGDKVQLPPLAAATAQQGPAQRNAPAADTAVLETARQNSEAAKTSPAAAAALATTGHASTAQELAELVAKGQASRCAVITNPPGAEVYIDGNKGGISPFAFVLLKQGATPRTITIKMAGYKTVEKQFIPDGRVIPISVTLEKQLP